MRYLPRPTVRLKLTLVYAGLLILTGFLGLTLNYFLVRRGIRTRPTVTAATIPPELRELFTQTAQQVRADAMRELLVQSAIALGVMAVASAAIGWFIAWRILRPLKRITGTARRLSGSNLHERIAIDGPSDELKELADTFDDMLARLEAAFESQRGFVANASHELRTPLSIIRTELDVTLSSPDPPEAELGNMADVVRAAIARSEHLIERLLVLARSESGLSDRRPLDLAGIAAEVVDELTRPIEEKRIDLRTDLSPGPVLGDHMLLNRLVGNLIENAIAHNQAGGWVRVEVRPTTDHAELRVSNSGPRVPLESVDELFEPFRRITRDRTGSSRGVGLGLSIVHAIVRAHGGEVSARPGEEGGLEVLVRIPLMRERTQQPNAAPVG